MIKTVSGVVVYITTPQRYDKFFIQQEKNQKIILADCPRHISRIFRTKKQRDGIHDFQIYMYFCGVNSEWNRCGLCGPVLRQINIIGQL